MRSFRWEGEVNRPKFVLFSVIWPAILFHKISEATKRNISADSIDARLIQSPAEIQIVTYTSYKVKYMRLVSLVEKPAV